METGKLPFRTSDFEALRLAEQIYIDKTDFVYELASERGKIFLSRPRRFGKSLLVSWSSPHFQRTLSQQILE